ncbi:S-layer homology domain-containing protein [uncultured Phascolarctobacterium sp.]|uniref:S-layer homology domain-containing protein n=1 Tax=uncultured Phascolarctobacterium sp. TaxID=512296 RepID=UPI0025DF1D47|nr:S-layer homology domain-containing protein [uncultured Phascolarctobacterium sp.]
MKKSLVLAMAMALGVTASAYAANPFSDVPAGHWAYDSINKLAAAGVIEGYGDATFGGDKLMTRYEMAQIVAKAMAKGANVDKLAAEFADELDNLGVRVANLEKKADNVKITGQIRFRNVHDYDAKGDKDATTLRTRLFVNGQINDDWSYTGMLQNVQEFDNNSGEDGNVDFKRAYVNGKLGGLAVTAGRWDEVPYTGNVADLTGDGVKVSYGEKVQVWGAALKANEATEDSADRVYLAGVNTTFGVVDAYAMYAKGNGKVGGITSDDNKEVYNVGASLDVAKDLNLAYEYMWGDKAYDNRVSKDGWVATLSYKGAEAATPGSWGLSATYYDQPVNAVLAPTTDAETFLKEGGYKGWGVTANYAFAKNIVGEVSYYDTEAKATSSDKNLLFADLFFTF